MTNGPIHWQGSFPGDPDPRVGDVEWFDVTQTYGQWQPEATADAIDTYRTGRLVRYVQDIASIAVEDTNEFAQVYPIVYPATRQSYDMILANVLNSPSIPGK